MENKPKFKPNPELRLMDQVRQVLRYHHYSYGVLASESHGPRFCEIPSVCQRQGWKGPPYNSVAIHLRRPEGTPFTCPKDIRAVSSPLETP